MAACSSGSRSKLLPARGELSAFKHTGFWECLDTYKDALQLNDLWEQGRPPWKTWD